MEKKLKCTEIAEEGYSECVVHRNAPGQEIVYRRMAFDGLTIGYGNRVDAPSVLLPDAGCIKISFLLQEVENLGDEEKAELPEYFEADFSEGFFRKAFPYNNFCFNSLKAEVESVIDLTRPGYGRVQLIKDIVHCRHKAWLKRLYLGTKVIELLFERIGSADCRFMDRGSIKGENVEKIYWVKEYLSYHLQTSATLADLAHKAGTNEFTLKKGFRELFGTSVFTFWTNVKMERARELLETTDLSISEVAEKVGYKNPQHFSVAFKRKYGMVPRHLRKNREV